MKGNNVVGSKRMTMPLWQRNLCCWSALVALALTTGCSPRLVNPSPASGPRTPTNRATVVPPPSNTSSNRALREVPSSSVVDLPSESSKETYYEVQPGDTPGGIAKQYGLKNDELLDANGLDGQSHIYPGQLLFIPSQR